MDPVVVLVDRLSGLLPGWLYLAAGALLAVEVGLLAGLWLGRRLRARSAVIGYDASGPPPSPSVPTPVPVPAPLRRRRLRRRSGSPLGQPHRPAGPGTRRPFPVGRGTTGRSVPGSGD
ncbi:hypothetical protein [Plantactinospora soyae]|uniref:Uncharacterized protein n=1 Tax=Plantactinospora soyae TaxID=1544732 RepID=A0A927M135_9ACTN|nr:hypothetical protein [Plantactinospora soyae]MBE1484781.1 hypothetical protein [Plantactinospora soyae]